jgi:hypothetical protein
MGKGGRRGLFLDKTCRPEKPLLNPILDITPLPIAGMESRIYESAGIERPIDPLQKECSVQDSSYGGIPEVMKIR